MSTYSVKLLATSFVVCAISACSTRAQVPADSAAAWAELLKSGTLVERVEAAGKLAAEDPVSLPASAQEAVVAELDRINEALLYDSPIEGLDELDSEGFGEYYLDLATMAYHFGNPEADRALIRSVGVSRGIQRRAARLGDEAIPVLAEMIERDYEAAGALEAMGLAWFWADSTGAPLSDVSRRRILEHITGATRSDRYSLRRAASTTLELTGDPGFVGYAEHFRESALAAGDRLIAADLESDAIPALEAAADALEPDELAARSQRLLRLICETAAAGPKAEACLSLEERFDDALDSLRAGRVAGAREALRSIVERAGESAAAGTLSADEEALIVGGARWAIRRI
jgi:hypothetical protein